MEDEALLEAGTLRKGLDRGKGALPMETPRSGLSGA